MELEYKKIEFRLGRDTLVARVRDRGDGYVVFLEGDVSPVFVPHVGKDLRNCRGQNPLPYRVAAEMAREYLEFDTEDQPAS